MPLIIRDRIALSFFLVGLVLSGVAAFPLAWETRLADGLGIGTSSPAENQRGLSFWISTVDRGSHETYAVYPG